MHLFPVIKITFIVADMAGSRPDENFDFLFKIVLIGEIFIFIQSDIVGPMI